MIRVNVKDLEGLKTLEFDLYTENGRMICPRGSSLTPGKILQLSYTKLYRKEGTPDPKREEETPVEAPPPQVIISEEPLEEPPGFDSKIDVEVKKTVLTVTRSFVDDVFAGRTPEVAACELARDNIVAEVTNKIEEVEYLGQLRMFDEYTYSHNVNVSALSVALGLKIGLREKDIKDLALATLLHDIGKMRIPKEVLNKPGRLTEKEFEVMKLHAALGYKVIKEELKLPFEISRVALEHQERFGGGGYPKNLMGDDIGKFSQICAIADVYDALISKRVYKPEKSSQEALKIMLSEGSKSFNPGLLYKFAHMCSYSEATPKS